MTEVLVHMAGMLTPRTCMQIIRTQHFIASVVLLLALIQLFSFGVCIFFGQGNRGETEHI